MNNNTEVENKRRFVISLVASIIGVISSIVMITIGKRGDSQLATLVLVMGYVALVAMLILFFEIVRLWKKNKFIE